MHDIKATVLPKGYVIEEDIVPVGVTLADIDAFIADAKSSGHVFEGKCTGEVNAIMKSITKNCSYCEHISKNQRASVSLFICFHAF
jgi:hypothetical protein